MNWDRSWSDELAVVGIAILTGVAMFLNLEAAAGVGMGALAVLVRNLGEPRRKSWPEDG